MIILYGFWRSSATWRARIALGLKNLTYEYRPVNLLAGDQDGDEYRTLNPMRQVPFLLLDEEDGTRIGLAQSLVIAEYLEERFPSPPLLPRDRVGRARVRQIAEAINSGIQPLAVTAVRKYVREELHLDEDAWSKHWVQRGLFGVEATVRLTAGRFAFGDTPTLADACIVPQLYHGRRFGIDTTQFPTLSAIDRACAELDAFSKTRPELQPDFPS